MDWWFLLLSKLKRIVSIILWTYNHDYMHFMTLSRELNNDMTSLFYKCQKEVDNN